MDQQHQAVAVALKEWAAAHLAWVNSDITTMDRDTIAALCQRLQAAEAGLLAVAGTIGAEAALAEEESTHGRTAAAAHLQPFRVDL